MAVLVREGEIGGSEVGLGGFVVKVGLNPSPHTFRVGIGEVLLNLQLLAMLVVFVDAPFLSASASPCVKALLQAFSRKRASQRKLCETLSSKWLCWQNS